MGQSAPPTVTTAAGARLMPVRDNGNPPVAGALPSTWTAVMTGASYLVERCRKKQASMSAVPQLHNDNGTCTHTRHVRKCGRVDAGAGLVCCGHRDRVRGAITRRRKERHFCVRDAGDELGFGAAHKHPQGSTAKVLAGQHHCGAATRQAVVGCHGIDDRWGNVVPVVVTTHVRTWLRTMQVYDANITSPRSRARTTQTHARTHTHTHKRPPSFSIAQQTQLKPPATSHQPPATNHQLPTTNHQPPTTNHQLPHVHGRIRCRVHLPRYLHHHRRRWHRRAWRTTLDAGGTPPQHPALAVTDGHPTFRIAKVRSIDGDHGGCRGTKKRKNASHGRGSVPAQPFATEQQQQQQTDRNNNNSSNSSSSSTRRWVSITRHHHVSPGGHHASNHTESQGMASQ